MTTQGPCSQHFNFVVTYECVQLVISLSLAKLSSPVQSNTPAYGAHS